MNDFKIKEELKEQYKTEMGKNCLDGYSFGVVQATVGVIGRLDQGQSPEEASEYMGEMGISGFMAGCVAQWISKFHERGDEYRKWWNKKCGVDEEKAQGGVVNPAIVTFTSKEN